MTGNNDHPGSGLLAIHLVAFLFGMTGILGSLIEADPATITFGRAAFAVAFLSPLLFLGARRGLQRQVNQTSAHQRPQLDTHRIGVTPANEQLVYTGLSGMLLSIHWVTFFMSVQTAGIALATLGFSSFAAFITCLEWLMNRNQISRADWLRTLGVTMGLVVLTPSISLADVNTYGFVLGLASGLAFAAMAVVNSRKLAGHNPIRVARNQNLIVVCLLIPLAWSELAALSMSSWLWLAILGIVCTGLSHSLFVYSLKRLRVSMAGLVVALEPVYAIAAAWVLFSQTPAPRTLLGGVVIVGSILGIRAAQASRQPARDRT